MTLRVGIVGGSGYTGGELLRLLINHRDVEVTQITSREQAGQYVYTRHPNLRGASRLTFVHPDALQPCDLLFLALPHGVAAREIERYAVLAPSLIDLSADFRLNDTTAYQRWYGEDHPNPDWLSRFEYGLPEVRREALRGAQFASGIGCNATAINLALLPLVREGLVERAAAALNVGSSEGGHQPSEGSHHPVRSGAVRTYKPSGHRHSAEVAMILGAGLMVDFAVTAIEMVRGVHLVAHVYLNAPQNERDLWRIYRRAYRDEPFIRLVSSTTGLHRYPEPRIVAGTNFCDIGFAVDEHNPCHVVVMAALDNLGKGAAGSAVQVMNIMQGFDECEGLRGIGVYP
ncbi:MAG: N-acetyl-gamma-glutamyl-phosphate reductase [bacterium]|nr:N-acetyl-gamma-glutamyl-phosphate reductase [bacterium]